MKISRFFREARRIAREHGLEATGITDKGKMELSYQNRYLGVLSENGSFNFASQYRDIALVFHEDVMKARQYVSDIENKPKHEFLPEGYKLLCEHGSVALAGRDMNEHGYQFVTWDWNESKNSLNHGHYYINDNTVL